MGARLSEPCRTFKPCRVAPTTCCFSVSSMDIPRPLQQALCDSIASGNFVDTKLWAFSSRNRTTGRVGNPQPLYVSGRVLGSLPGFQYGQSRVPYALVHCLVFDSVSLSQPYLGRMTQRTLARAPQVPWNHSRTATTTLQTAILSLRTRRLNR